MKLEDLEELRKTFPSLIPVNGKHAFEKGWQRWCEEPRPFNLDDFKSRNAGSTGGPANGVLFLDVDHVPKFGKMCKERGWSLPETRMHMTGTSKPHYVYQYPRDGKRYGCRSIKDPEGEKDETGKPITVFDVKGLGGYVVAPGSIHPDTGKPYTVRLDVPPAPAPQWLLDLARDEDRAENRTDKPEDQGRTLEGLSVSLSVRNLIETGLPKGERSEGIMAVLNALARAECSDEEIIRVFEQYPIGEKYREKGRTRERWLLKQANKARASLKDRSQPSLAQAVRDYLDSIDGSFRTVEIARDLNIVDAEGKANVRTILKRLKGKVIEQHRGEAGHWRKLNDECERMDLTGISTEPVRLWLPLDLRDLVKVHAGNIIVVSGSTNSGKTSFVLNTIKENLDDWEIHFFNSEMDRPELKERLELFGDFPITHPNFNPYKRTSDFADVIRPGEGVLNVIDFLEMNEEFYLAGKYMKEIHNRLDGAVALIAVQNKNRFQHGGLGGERLHERPRLVVSLIPGEAKIIKGKAWASGTNPRDLIRKFKLVKGSKFFPLGGWQTEPAPKVARKDNWK